MAEPFRPPLRRQLQAVDFSIMPTRIEVRSEYRISLVSIASLMCNNSAAVKFSILASDAGRADRFSFRTSPHRREKPVRPLALRRFQLRR
jgi:hypothetical protein